MDGLGCYCMTLRAGVPNVGLNPPHLPGFMYTKIFEEVQHQQPWRVARGPLPSPVPI